MKKIYLLLVVALLIPSFAYAAWWNPSTWNWNPFFWWIGVANGPVNDYGPSLPTSSLPAATVPSPSPPSLPDPKTTSKANSPIQNTPPNISPPNVTVVNPQPIVPAVPPPAPSGTPCNGTYYSSCPSGEDFVCPSSGQAYCQPSQQQEQAGMAAQKQQALAQLEANLQSWQNSLIPSNNQIAQTQAQISSQCSGMDNLSEAGGGQGLEQNLIAEQCLSLTQEIQNIYTGEAPTLKEIQAIQQQIYQIENSQ